LLLLLCCLLPLIRCYAVIGWLRPTRIAGGSMAGKLYGPCYLIRCRDCQITFRCGAEYVPREQRSACPNCGFSENPIAPAAHQAGRRVTIDRWPQWRDGPQLWQSVAFAQREQHDAIAVKRIVACGGGQVQIRDGDVFVDGQVQQKNLDQLRSMRVLVHDDRYRPASSEPLPNRWQGATRGSRWQVTPAGYRCAANERSGELDWLTYSQWTCWLNPSPPKPRTTAIAIFDYYAYNQNLSRGALNRVRDLTLVTRFQVRGKGVTALLIDNGYDCFQLQISHPAAYCCLRHDGLRVWQQPLQATDLWSVELALCDHQVLVEVNGVELPRFAYRPAVSQRSGPQRLAIGAARLEMELRLLQIYRDVHYVGPSGEHRWLAPNPLARDQYFAIGDNVPVSVDSRRMGPISSAAIIGPVAPLSEGPL
jgi:hypothetical protein